MSALLRSGELAAVTGVNVQTLRYYERRGLLLEPGFPVGGHRQFSAEAITTMRVIKAAQQLGFTLDEVSDLLKVSRIRRGHRADAGLQSRAARKLAEVYAKLAELLVVRGTLRAALQAGCGRPSRLRQEPLLPIVIQRRQLHDSRWQLGTPAREGGGRCRWDGGAGVHRSPRWTASGRDRDCGSL
jgi:DNA-binding transcriptional MerR regulator